MAENVPQVAMSANVETPNEPDLSANTTENQSGVDKSVKDVSSGPSLAEKSYTYVRDLLQSATTNKEGYKHLDSKSLSTNLDRLSKTALRFGNQNPVVPSPQLQDTYHDGETRIDLVSSPPTDFRIILYVKDYEMEEVCINFTEDTMEIRMSHDERRLSTGLTCRRDSCYYFLLPPTVSKESLSAQWTRDHFLVIQSRRYKQQEKVQQEKDSVIERLIVNLVERLIPVRVEANLRPKPDFGNMKVLSEAIALKIAEINGYLGLRCRIPKVKPFRLIPSHLKKGSVSMGEYEKMQYIG